MTNEVDVKIIKLERGYGAGLMITETVPRSLDNMPSIVLNLGMEPEQLSSPAKKDSPPLTPNDDMVVTLPDNNFNDPDLADESTFIITGNGLITAADDFENTPIDPKSALGRKIRGTATALLQEFQAQRQAMGIGGQVQDTAVKQALQVIKRPKQAHIQ